MIQRFDVPKWLATVTDVRPCRSQPDEIEFVHLGCSDHKPRGKYSKTKGFWSCYNCSKGGSAVGLFMETHRVTYPRALASMNAMETHGVELVISQLVEATNEANPVVPIFDLPTMTPPPGTVPVHPSNAYAAKRGICKESLSRWRVGYCQDQFDRHYNHLVFPVFDGIRLIYWQTRDCFDPVGTSDERREWARAHKWKKTLNPTGGNGRASAGQVLMGLNTVRGRSVLLVEGPIDRRGAFDAAATLGKKLSPHQIMRLLEVGITHVDFCWDRDARGEAEAAAESVSSLFSRVRVVDLPDDRDPGALGPTAVGHLRNRARVVGAAHRNERVGATVRF